MERRGRGFVRATRRSVAALVVVLFQVLAPLATRHHLAEERHLASTVGSTADERAAESASERPAPHHDDEHSAASHEPRGIRAPRTPVVLEAPAPALRPPPGLEAPGLTRSDRVVVESPSPRRGWCRAGPGAPRGPPVF